MRIVTVGRVSTDEQLVRFGGSRRLRKINERAQEQAAHARATVVRFKVGANCIAYLVNQAGLAVDVANRARELKSAGQVANAFDWRACVFLSEHPVGVRGRPGTQVWAWFGLDLPKEIAQS